MSRTAKTMIGIGILIALPIYWAVSVVMSIAILAIFVAIAMFIG